MTALSFVLLSDDHRNPQSPPNNGVKYFCMSIFIFFSSNFFEIFMPSCRKNVSNFDNAVEHYGKIIKILHGHGCPFEGWPHRAQPSKPICKKGWDGHALFDDLSNGHPCRAFNSISRMLILKIWISHPKTSLVNRTVFHTFSSSRTTKPHKLRK